MIRGVLFDLDNTLADFLRMKRLASHEAARAMVDAGARFDVDLDAAGDALYDHYLDTGIESDDAFSRFLEKHNQAKLSWGHHRSDRILASGIQAYLRAKDTFLRPYPGVRATLVDLTRMGLRLGVLTDAPRLKAWQRLNHLSIAEFFEVVVTQDDSGAQKPHPRAYRQAVDNLGFQPFEVLMVGDWPEKDIQGAQEYGLRTALAEYGRTQGKNGDHGADFVIHSITEVPRCVKTLNTT